MVETLLNNEWVNRLTCYNVLYVGFSGGLDSTVLLHALASQPTLLQKIHAVHINHGLSEHALQWERHCEQFCAALAIPLSVHGVDISVTNNIEECARKARYAVFDSILSQADALLLAHHEDDQAETLLLNLMRGAGVDGMAAMQSVKSLAQGDLLRPLLSYSQTIIESYALHYGLSWVEDESNQDERFSRNFIRHRIMPLLQEKWPQAVHTIARGSRHCQEASRNLDALAKLDCADLATCSNRLSVAALTVLPVARVLNVLRVWLKQNGHQRPSEKTLKRLLDEVMLARVDAMPMVSFGDVVVRRYREYLYCLMNAKRVTQTMVWLNFPSPLNLGDSIGTLHVEPSNEGLNVSLSSRIEVRFRVGGELFHWHGQTKTLKHLFQQWQVPPWMRDLIPLLYIDDKLAVVVGYAVSDYFYVEKSCSQNTVAIVCLYKKMRK